jgi:hypothetical protein
MHFTIVSEIRNVKPIAAGKSVHIRRHLIDGLELDDGVR